MVRAAAWRSSSPPGHDAPDTCVIPVRLPELALERHRAAVRQRLGRCCLKRGWVFFGHRPRCHGPGEHQCGERHGLIEMVDRGGLRMSPSRGTGVGGLRVGFGVSWMCVSIVSDVVQC